MNISTIIGIITAVVSLIMSILALYKIYDHTELHHWVNMIPKHPDWAELMKENRIKDLESRVKKLEADFKAIPVDLMETKNHLGLKEKYVAFDDAIDIAWITCYLQVDLLAREAGVDITNNLDDAKYAKFKLTKNDHTLLIDINKEITGPRLYQTLAIQVIKFVDECKEIKNDK